jgi:hypothetical protein
MKKPLKTSPDGRKCSFAGCKCILSIYNHEAFCRVHRERALQEQKQGIIAYLEVSTQ